jgi:hypothetical protein
MRYEISEQGKHVQIQIHQTGEHTPRLVASLQDCREGRCSCPTDQYDRLEDMTVQTGVDQLTVRLHPKPGQRLDTDQLQACLDYTLDQAEHSTE